VWTVSTAFSKAEKEEEEEEEEEEEDMCVPSRGRDVESTVTETAREWRET